MVTRVALLGAGIGEKHLEAYLKQRTDFSVILIVDQDRPRAEKLLRSTGCEIATDIESALNHPDIDLIDICLPPHLHAPVSKAAFRAGKDVICEKPIATSLKELDIMKEAMEQNNRKFYPVFQYRWGPSIEQLRHLISTDLAGKPLVATLETHWNRGTDYYAVDWRGTWAGESGGAVLGHAIHNHDLLMHIMGPIRTVTGFADTRVNQIETEDCAALCFKLANGALATSSVTLGNALDESRMRFVFEHLTATSGSNPYAPGETRWEFKAKDETRQTEIDKAIENAPVSQPGFEGLLAAIADERAGRSNNVVTFEDGYNSIELVTAIYKAVRSGEMIRLPLTRDDPMFSGWQP